MEIKPDFLKLYALNKYSNRRALVLVLLLLIIFRFQVFTGITTYYLGGSHADAGLYFYLFRHHLQHLFSISWFDLYAFAPYPLALAWSDNFILPAILALPFYLIGVPETLLYNAVLLLAHLLLGYTTYRVTLLIAGIEKIALFAGATTLSLAYFTHSLGHPQLQFAFCFPLAIEILLRGLNRPFSSGLLFGCLVIGMFLTTVYYSLFLLVFPPTFYLALFVVHPNKVFAKKVARFLLGGLTVAPTLLPFVYPYQKIKETFGARGLYEMYAFRATTDSLLSAPPLSYMYGPTATLSQPEAYFFPGFFLLLSPIFAFLYIGNAKPLKLPRRVASGAIFSSFLLASPSLLGLFVSSTVIDKAVRAYAVPFSCYLALTAMLYFGLRLGAIERNLTVTFMTTRAILFALFFTLLVFFYLSLGPTISPEDSLPQLSLFSLAYFVFPGLDAARAISRAGAPMLLLLPILSALGVWLVSREGKTPLLNHMVFLPLSFLLVAGENSLSNYALEPRDGAPVAAHHISSLQTEEDITVFLPFTDALNADSSVKSWRNFAHRNVDFMNWSLDLNLQIVNGYSGQRTKVMRELPGMCKNFPDLTCLNALSEIANVSFLVFESKHIENFDEALFLKKIEGLKEHLSLLKRDGEGYFLFRLTRITKPSHLVTIRALPRFSRAEGTVLSFAVKMPYEEEQSPTDLLLFEPDHTNLPLGRWSLPQDGKWHRIHLTTDLTPKRAVPFRFEFTTDPSSRLQIKEFALHPK